MVKARCSSAARHASPAAKQARLLTSRRRDLTMRSRRLCLMIEPYISVACDVFAVFHIHDYGSISVIFAEHPHNYVNKRIRAYVNREHIGILLFLAIAAIPSTLVLFLIGLYQNTYRKHTFYVMNLERQRFYLIQDYIYSTHSPKRTTRKLAQVGKLCKRLNPSATIPSVPAEATSSQDEGTKLRGQEHYLDCRATTSARCGTTTVYSRLHNPRRCAYLDHHHSFTDRSRQTCRKARTQSYGPTAIMLG